MEYIVLMYDMLLWYDILYDTVRYDMNDTIWLG